MRVLKRLQKNNFKDIQTQLINFLIQGRVNEKLNFSIERVEKELNTLGLSSLNYEFIEEQILEYQEKGNLEIWKDINFKKLSRRITDILGVRNSIENIVLTAIDNKQLTDMLAIIVNNVIENPSEAVRITLSQCFMKDMSVQKEEAETREKIYLNWIQSVVEGGIK